MHGGKLFSCNLCPKQFKWEVDLARHKQSKHEGLRFKCSFVARSSLRNEALEFTNSQYTRRKGFGATFVITRHQHLQCWRLTYFRVLHPVMKVRYWKQ